MSRYVWAHIAVITEHIERVILRGYAFGASVEACLAKPNIRFSVIMKNGTALR